MDITIRIETAEERREDRERFDKEIAAWEAETVRRVEESGLGPYRRGEITFWQHVKMAWLR